MKKWFWEPIHILLKILKNEFPVNVNVFKEKAIMLKNDKLNELNTYYINHQTCVTIHKT